MTSALASPVRHPDRLFIGGAWTPSAGGSSFAVTDSNDEGLYVDIVAAGPEDVSRAVVAARTAFDSGPWPRMTPAERAPYLRAFVNAIRERSDLIADSWARETGTVVGLGRGGGNAAARFWEQAADLADSVEWTERHPTSDGRGYGLLARTPAGVVGAIIPWNSPMLTGSMKLAPALLAGCTVVLKASPEAPVSAYLLAEIAEEVGLPDGVLNVLTADREVSELLVTDPRVDKITFTGSTAAGRRIGSIVGGRIGRMTLELGGKSAAVVLDDADIEAAARSLALSEINMTGQACLSLTRIVVQRDRHDEMLEAIAETFRQVAVGSALETGSQMGPLASAAQLERVAGYIEIGRRSGAVLAAGGGRPEHLPRGYFVEPTVFGGVDNSSRIAQEEIFGPVLSVIPADSEDEAIRIANDTVYGLYGSVFTSDTDRYARVAGEIRAGTVSQNGFRSSTSIAFGGFKQSGVGREGGKEGILDFTETKVLLYDDPA
ncbi:aldehyde dehydrogenase [Pseudofrankia asymbiotica]|uniref:Aldehyde dehydrogenase n=1 Tax=Pseudofrankia asymbiotica TaxID=1834516 RepID=A0A1V2I1N7_9ACTN|nr:aldehyde dehydrogenase [Pseudofrankia asymbiotica]ONH22236.1 aldehyde dehydrogenase [Pseudofrankia asymbiotica]